MADRPRHAKPLPRRAVPAWAYGGAFVALVVVAFVLFQVLSSDPEPETTAPTFAIPTPTPVEPTVTPVPTATPLPTATPVDLSAMAWRSVAGPASTGGPLLLDVLSDQRFVAVHSAESGPSPAQAAVSSDGQAWVALDLPAVPLSGRTIDAHDDAWVMIPGGDPTLGPDRVERLGLGSLPMASTDGGASWTELGMSLPAPDVGGAYVTVVRTVAGVAVSNGAVLVAIDEAVTLDVAGVIRDGGGAFDVTEARLVRTPEGLQLQGPAGAPAVSLADVGIDTALQERLTASGWTYLVTSPGRTALELSNVLEGSVLDLTGGPSGFEVTLVDPSGLFAVTSSDGVSWDPAEVEVTLVDDAAPSSQYVTGVVRADRPAWTDSLFIVRSSVGLDTGIVYPHAGARWPAVGGDGARVASIESFEFERGAHRIVIGDGVAVIDTETLESVLSATPEDLAAGALPAGLSVDGDELVISSPATGELIARFAAPDFIDRFPGGGPEATIEDFWPPGDGWVGVSLDGDRWFWQRFGDAFGSVQAPDRPTDWSFASNGERLVAVVAPVAAETDAAAPASWFVLEPPG